MIPIFHRPDALREAVPSVLSQQGVNLEVIVIDDSAEGSAEPVVREIADARVSYAKNPTPGQGRPPVVRNMGWPKADGNFIDFLDDDDRVPGSHYRAVKDRFEAAPPVGVVFGRVAPFGTDETLLRQERLFFANVDVLSRNATCMRRGGYSARPHRGARWVRC